MKPNQTDRMFGNCLENVWKITGKKSIFEQKTNMASVNFRLRNSTQKESSIYITVSLGRKNFFELKSGFSILPDDWNKKVSLPRHNTPQNRNLYADLKKLEAYIHDSLNNAQSKGEFVDKIWVQAKIKECFNRIEKNDVDSLIDYIQSIIDNAHTKKVNGRNGLGLSESRIKGYKTFKSIIELFQKSIKKTILLTDINQQFFQELTSWMFDVQKFSVNYAGKQIDNLKAVCTDAQRMDKKVNSQFQSIKSFSESSEDRYIVTLSFSEIEKILKADMPSDYLENAKKWLILGCEIGQRGDDLLNITSENFRIKDNIFILDLVQGKTKKAVSIPIMKEEVIDILKNSMPRKVSLQKLNEYIKKVCSIAEINYPTEGYKRVVEKDKKVRKAFGIYPKSELISSHSFRRSYATNYYKDIPTPILMGITGHSRESTFLQYINKQSDKDDNALNFASYYNKMQVK